MSRSACELAIRKAVEANKGRFVKSTGDGTLSAFGSTVDAMRAALDVLSAITQQNSSRLPTDVLRCGSGLLLATSWSKTMTSLETL